MRRFLQIAFFCATILVIFAVTRTTSNGKAVAANNSAVPSSAAPIAPQSTPEQLAKAQKCKAFLSNDRSGIVHSYRVDGNSMIVEVGPIFYAADFDTKAAVNGFMRCVATDGRMDNTVNFIEYIDRGTHHEAAAWTPDLGLNVK